MKRYTVYLILFTLVYGCTNSTVKPLLKKSSYDNDFRYYSEQLTGKTRKLKHIKKMESAYQSAQKADLMAADSMLNLDHPDRWLYINGYHRRLQERQQKVLALMPLQSKDGYKPDLLILPNIAERESASRKASAQYLYQQSETLLGSGRRADARTAYSMLFNLKDNYYAYWENTIELLDSAAIVGVEHVLVTGDYKFSPGYMDSKWQKFYRDPYARETFDIIIHSRALEVTVQPQNETTQVYAESKEIEVSYTEKRDSTGNVIERTPIYETATATVLETTLEKIAKATVVVEVLDGTTGTILTTTPILSSYLFRDMSITYVGDPRALSPFMVQMAYSIPIPSDLSMENNVLGRLDDDFMSFIKSRLWTAD